jgi:hypothetical protein
MYIFVSGFGHAGTTLMTVMLGSHPQTHLIPYETRWFLWEDKVKEAVDYAQKINKPYIIEKTPMHVRKIDAMHNSFPDAKFIVMIRNPYDVIASQYKRHADIEKAINRMHDDYFAIKKAHDLGYVKVVRYENVIEHTSDELKDICNFLGITFCEQMLNYHQQSIEWEGVEPRYSDGVGEKEHLHRRAWQVSQPLFDGRGRHKELSQDHINYVNSSLGHIIDELKYERI